MRSSKPTSTVQPQDPFYMQEAALNIAFLGTGTGAGDYTVTKFVMNDVRGRQQKPTLILAGVGAAASKPKNAEDDDKTSYLTPGTFAVDEQGKQKKKFGISSLFYRLAGLIRGTGEKSNIELSVAAIRAQLAKKKDGKILINLTGFSRGGSSAIRLMNRCYELFGYRVQFNAMIRDPNAGFGRHSSPRKINFPPNVGNVYFVFSSEDPGNLLASKGLAQYVFADPKTRVSAIQLMGGHIRQECDLGTPEYDQNKYYLGTFFEDQKKLHQNMLADQNNKSNASFVNQDVNPNFKFFNTELGALNNPTKNNLGSLLNVIDFSAEIESYQDKKDLLLALQYQCYQLYCELWRDFQDPAKRASITAVAKQVSVTIDAFKKELKDPSKDKQNLQSAVVKLEETFKINSVSDRIRTMLGKVVGVISAIVGCVLGLVGGFFAGITYGGLPGAAIGAAKTAKAAYKVSGKIAGKAHQRNLLKTLQSDLKTPVPMPASTSKPSLFQAPAPSSILMDGLNDRKFGEMKDFFKADNLHYTASTIGDNEQFSVTLKEKKEKKDSKSHRVRFDKTQKKATCKELNEIVVRALLDSAASTGVTINLYSLKGNKQKFMDIYEKICLKEPIYRDCMKFKVKDAPPLVVPHRVNVRSKLT